MNKKGIEEVNIWHGVYFKVNGNEVIITTNF